MKKYSIMRSGGMYQVVVDAGGASHIVGRCRTLQAAKQEMQRCIYVSRMNEGLDGELRINK